MTNLLNDNLKKINELGRFINTINPKSYMIQQELTKIIWHEDNTFEFVNVRNEII